MEVGGLVEVMSWVLGFGRQAEVLAPAHLREVVAEELAVAGEQYGEDREVLAAIDAVRKLPKTSLGQNG